MIVFSDLIIRGRLSLFQFNLEIYTKYFTLPNLNQASKEELCQINGIGDKKADMIIQYRQQHGPFKSIDELKNVDGFGDKTVAKLKDQVAV